MELSYFSFVFISFSCFFFQAVSRPANVDNSKGRAFLLSFIPTLGNASQNGVIVTTETKTTVFINIPATGSLTRHFLNKDSSFMFKLPSGTTVQGPRVHRKQAVAVYSTDPVSVYGVTLGEGSQGAYLALPIDKWGNHYVVATYQGLNKTGGEIVIVAAEDDTTVTILFNVLTSTRCLGKKTSFDRQHTMRSDLGREDVLRVFCEDDLTGSIIKSSKPVAVISGTPCAAIPQGSPECDLIVEMMPPTRVLGREYVVPTLAERKSIIRVVYLEPLRVTDKTNVTFTFSGGVGAFTQDNRLFTEVAILPGTVVRLNSSQPVLVVVYTTSAGVRDGKVKVGDASMAVVAPVGRFDACYNLNVDWTQLLGNLTSYLYHVTAVCPDNNTLLDIDGFNVNSRRQSGFNIYDARKLDRKFLDHQTFPPSSNLILTVSGPGSGMALPLGLKIDFFTGVDNCSSDPCKNQGICYVTGNKVTCYCGDQLSGDSNEHNPDNLTNFIKYNNNSNIDNNTVTTSGRWCACTCKNITQDIIDEKKEEIEKELTIDAKTTHNTRIKYESAYDERPSAAGIGILGVLFLALAFGSVVLLDVLSAVSYIVTRFMRRKKKDNHENKPANLGQPAVTSPEERQPSWKDRITLIQRYTLPRAKLDGDVLSVNGVDYDTFNLGDKQTEGPTLDMSPYDTPSKPDPEGQVDEYHLYENIQDLIDELQSQK
ncbi:uncharacterized protein LOC131938722 [Physella acuta]|uniref:uncharacterized protein LOC131938722 n=1 Tax=Physella acuta TaxID=109671 RepID=UPI0027DE28B3|nr:uncharacterized protein LOC131938722 [Physella acuta]